MRNCVDQIVNFNVSGLQKPYVSFKNVQKNIHNNVKKIPERIIRYQRHSGG